VTDGRTAPAIIVDGVTKRYGERTVLDDVSFTVPQGSITGFLGRNGAGKTTTMRILLGLAEPDAGTATILGRPYAALPHPGRQVGALLETASFHPGRSGADHLKLTALQAGLDTGRVPEVLELVGLEEHGRRRVGGYSLGMRQRLGLAAALLGDPQVLLLDEPANGLDPAGVRWLRDFLRQMADAGRTVLLSSHVLAEVALSVDRVVVLHEGRLRMDAPLDRLLELAGGDGHAQLEDAFIRLTEHEAPTPPAPRLPEPTATPGSRADELATAWELPEDELAAQLGTRGSREPQIVAVSGVKGGVGRTTVALALADALAADGHRRVACLDADPRAGTLLALAGGDAPRDLDTIADHARSIRRYAQLAGLALRRSSGADLYGFPPFGQPSALGPAEYDVLLRMLRHFYEVVVVDVGGSPHEPLGALCVGRATHVVVVSTADRVAAGVTAGVLDGLDPGKATVVLNRTVGDRVGAAALRSAVGAEETPVATLPALTAGVPLEIPFDSRLADPPWEPQDLAEETRLGLLRLAWTVEAQ
jgi:ABC-2 type transport system ATP-binding protein